MQICPDCVYLPLVSVCTAGTSIVSWTAIIACNLHRIRRGNSVLISNKAGRVSICSTDSDLTAEQNDRFSCRVLNRQNLQGFSLFYFLCALNSISSKCSLFICSVCFITPLPNTPSRKIASSFQVNLHSLCFLCHRIHVAHAKVQLDQKRSVIFHKDSTY